MDPTPTPPPDTEPVMAEVAEKRPRRVIRIGCAGPFLLAVFVPLTVGLLTSPFWLPWELAQWEVAKAQNKRLDGDAAGAIAILDGVIDRYPEKPSLYRERAAVHTMNEDYEAALADLDKCLQLDPDDQNVQFYLRGELLLHLGRHEDAVKLSGEYLALADQSGSLFAKAQALNWAAYARAIGDTELDEALRDINESLRLLGDEPEPLDTRGFVYFQRGEYTLALKDLDRAVKMIEDRYAGTGDARGVPTSSDPRLRKLQLKSVAVIRYHRALVHDKLGNTDEAAEDRQRVREIGYGPDEHLF